MRKNLQYFDLCSAVALLFLSGCHAFYPHGQWQYGQNNPYGAPPQQGARIYAPNEIQPGTDLGQPGTLNGMGSSNRGNDPTFNRSTNRADQIQGTIPSQDNPVDKLVPKYPDPNDPLNNGTQNNGTQNNSENSGEELPNPFGNEGTGKTQSSSSNGVKFAEFSSQEQNGFKTPVNTAGSDLISSNGPEFATEAMPNPYAHDTKNFEWLRGKVSYDKAGKTWHIIYSLNPDPQDQFGGDLTLVGVPQNLELEDGDVALVEGFVDNESKDARGKPLYRINKMFGPLAPRGELAKEETIQAQNASKNEPNSGLFNSGPRFSR